MDVLFRSDQNSNVVYSLINSRGESVTSARNSQSENAVRARFPVLAVRGHLGSTVKLLFPPKALSATLICRSVDHSSMN